MEAAYLDLLHDILSKGEERSDRTGVGTYSLFGRQLSCDLGDGFPLLTTKKVFFRGVVEELLWMISGSTSILPLQEKEVYIWDEWADENGELGPVYGAQWRNCGNTTPFRQLGIDQLQSAIDMIRDNPFSRRILVDSWNVGQIGNMALPPCHLLYQFYVHTDGRLSCHMYQRSADIFLGVPFNIASYALLTHMMAEVTKLNVGELTISFGDIHLYKNHSTQAQEQLTRDPKKAPQLLLDHIGHIDDFRAEHVKLIGYEPHPAIEAEVAV